MSNESQNPNLSPGAPGGKQFLSVDLLRADNTVTHYDRVTDVRILGEGTAGGSLVQTDQSGTCLWLKTQAFIGLAIYPMTPGTTPTTAAELVGAGAGNGQGENWRGNQQRAPTI